MIYRVRGELHNCTLLSSLLDPLHQWSTSQFHVHFSIVEVIDAFSCLFNNIYGGKRERIFLFPFLHSQILVFSREKSTVSASYIDCNNQFSLSAHFICRALRWRGVTTHINLSVIPGKELSKEESEYSRPNKWWFPSCLSSLVFGVHWSPYI